jgi:hypothetical protein
LGGFDRLQYPACLVRSDLLRDPSGPSRNHVLRSLHRSTGPLADADIPEEDESGVGIRVLVGHVSLPQERPSGRHIVKRGRWVVDPSTLHAFPAITPNESY